MKLGLVNDSDDDGPKKGGFVPHMFANKNAAPARQNGATAKANGETVRNLPPTIQGMFANAKNIQKPKRVVGDIASSPKKEEKKNTRMKVDNSLLDASNYSYDPSKAQREKVTVSTNFGISSHDN